MPKLLTAEDILKANDIKIEAVEVPEWGGTVHVRQFSAAVRDQFDALISSGDGDEPDLTNVRGRVLALSVCDPDGKPLFTLEQAEALGAKSDAAIARVYDAAAKLNKLRKSDHDGEKKG
jgi:hypothetical protein